MAEGYRIIGAEMSPYSVKVRSYFRYKGIPHQWVLRNAASQAEYEKHAKMPIIPLVVTPEGTGIQDSTPIIDQMEKLLSGAVDPSRRTGHAFRLGADRGVRRRVGQQMDVSLPLGARGRPALLGRAHRADARPQSERRASTRISPIRCAARMMDRVWFVGSNETNAPQIESGFQEMLGLLDEHLAKRPYLFGGRPAFGDFGLWGQFYELWTDPTTGALIEGNAPHVLDWVHRMLWPRPQGAFESWTALAPTLMPILTKQVGKQFWPWTLANERALAEGKEEFSVTLGDKVWTQKPQKYHARSLGMLRAKYAEIPGSRELDMILAAAGCLAGLRA